MSTSYDVFLILSVPDKGYSTSYDVFLILSVPDKGYSRNICAKYKINFIFDIFNY